MKGAEMGGNAASAPLYTLVEEESGRVSIVAHEISGFFVQPKVLESHDILILGSPLRPLNVGDVLSDMELRVVDLHGNSIGSYYIGRVGIRSVIEVDEDSSHEGFVVTFYGLASPYVAAGEIWRRWASGVPIRLGEWSSWSGELHRSWLHVVQTAWFAKGLEPRRYATGAICRIDGLQILNEASFYCALGDAVNGAGGYFGSNLDALDDCLKSSLGAGVPFELLWDNFAIAQKRMGKGPTAAIIDVLRESGVAVAAT
jgi:RNAse (barnase) inhibitor barstar